MFEVGNRIMFDVITEVFEGDEEVVSYGEGEILEAHEDGSFDIRLTAEKPSDGYRYETDYVVYHNKTPSNMMHMYDCDVCSIWSVCGCIECNDTGLTTRASSEQVKG